MLTGTDREEYERVVKTTTVAQIMTKSPMTITPDAPLKDAVKVMVERKFGALPVVDGMKLVGIITQTDALRAFLTLLLKET
jgi:acetoin utilization protein AcuB